MSSTESGESGGGSTGDSDTSNEDTDDNSGFLSSIIDRLGDVAERIANLPTLLIEGVVEGIKSIFVPNVDYIENKVQYLRDEFLALGVGFYDMSDIFNTEKPFADITATIRGQEVVLVNMDIADKAVQEFRGIIRGFIVLMIVIYNYNQFMGFIGQQGLTLGGVIVPLVKGEKQ